MRGTIIWDIKAGIPVTLTRLAELVELKVKETEEMLNVILNETSSLGEYHKKEQVFIKKQTDNTSGTKNMIEDNSHEINNEGSFDEENSEEFKLDRIKIESSSEINWIGVAK